jgi:hypothetical protein
MKNRAPEELDWEVLPPVEKERRASVDQLFKWIALIMDDFLRLPGTKLRFGLDPLIGLIPGLGDTSSAIVSAMALIQAARRGVPKILLARMSLNILVNEIVGIVPVVGDAFSFWFKSNRRNYDLLQKHIGRPGRSRKSDWLFVVAVLAILFLVVCAGLFVSMWILQQLFRPLPHP